MDRPLGRRRDHWQWRRENQLGLPFGCHSKKGVVRLLRPEEKYPETGANRDFKIGKLLVSRNFQLVDLPDRLFPMANGRPNRKYPLPSRPEGQSLVLIRDA
jgi:hypothetical protein